MGNITVVFVVCLIIWIGIFLYLLQLDKQIKKIKKKIEFQEDFLKDKR
jgi:CcmD family protein